MFRTHIASPKLNKTEHKLCNAESLKLQPDSVSAKKPAHALFVFWKFWVLCARWTSTQNSKLRENEKRMCWFFLHWHCGGSNLEELKKSLGPSSCQQSPPPANTPRLSSPTKLPPVVASSFCYWKKHLLYLLRCSSFFGCLLLSSRSHSDSNSFCSM